MANQTALPFVSDGGKFIVVFDGGSLGNPGQGYGSFVIRGTGGYAVHERLDYGDGVTNNQAEYRTLIAALQRLGRDLPAVDRAQITIYGDSQLVLNQLRGAWKVKNRGLAPLYQEARGLLQRFGGYRLQWQPREESVRVLGH